MPKPLNEQDFTALQNATRAGRQSLKENQAQFQTARTELSQANSELQAELAKGIHADRNKVRGLENTVIAAQTAVNDFSSNVSAAEENITANIGEILFELDPRALLGFLDDDVPIFTMPLRVETRFMTVKHIARISEVQMANLPRPRIEMQNGVLVRVPPKVQVEEAFDRYTHMPVIEDSHELWVRIFPDDIAIHTHEKALTNTELEAGKTYWNHIWYAGPDENLRIGAWRGLVSGRGPERAAWVARTTRPDNHASQPTVTTAPDLPLPTLPIFPSPPIKDSSWTEMPHSRVMPDRVVVRAYQGESYREIVGRPIPDPLPLSIDPGDTVNTIDASGSDLTLPDKLKWIQDFEEAEKIGMGIRVPLSPMEQQAGFTRLIVAGVKTSADKEEGKELVEDLVENHHYTKTGLSIVPQGTPTNNTDDAPAGHTEDTSTEEDLHDIETGPPLFEDFPALGSRSDGQFLADALGIDYDVLHHIRNADYRDIKEAMCMNTALWPTTLGYYLRHLLHPMFSSTEINRVKSHFQSHVLGRGRIPAIRVGSQPYGILATTAFSKLAYDNPTGTESVLSKMHTKLLKPMSTVWDNLANQVARASVSVNPSAKNKQFLEIIGLHPSSVEFYQRFASGSYFLWNLYNYSNIIQGATGVQNVSYVNSIQFASSFANLGLSSLHAPRVFDLAYIEEHKFLNGPVIDRLKLSETRGIKSIGSNDENYIDWLIQSNWEQIRSEDFSNIGAGSIPPPKALLYLMLRHSCLLEYVRTGLTILSGNNIVSENAILDHELVNYTMQTSITPEIRNLLRANVFVNEAAVYEADLDVQVDNQFIDLANQGALNGYSLAQFESEKAVFKDNLRADSEQAFLRRVDNTFDDELSQLQIPETKVGLLGNQYSFLNSGNSLHEYIYDRIWGSPSNQDVQEMQELVKAMDCLKDLPTGRLERCFAEHIDLTSYRLDAWFTSLASQRLAKHRSVESSRKTGVYIGAYGWLENVQPNPDFPGIHYQEVEVQSNFIIVPGFTQVNTDQINNMVTVVGQDIWGEIDPAAVANLAEPEENRSGNGAVVYGREVPLDPVYEEYRFLERPPAEFTGVSYASSKAATIASVVNQIEVDQPWPILNSEALFDSPMCSYLGTTGMGNVMLDPVKNKFIHVPREDSNNQGYIHAPSINQATAAAVLRAGYESHRSNPGSPDNALAVNLSSARVRRSKFYLEGMKNGQELGALLGYQFERGLHDHELNLDQYILEFRLKFPLVAGRVTNSGGLSEISDAESYNVVNGLGLVEQSPNPLSSYPYGVSGLPASGTSKNAIVSEVEKLHDALDGINDLMMAEAMYQVVQGNHPRAGSALNALAGKGVPSDPQVVDTPRSFHVLTHRLGIQFDLSSGGHSVWTGSGTPRSLAEPGLNRWLGTVLPPAINIVFNYGYRFIGAAGTQGSLFGGTANAGNLGIEPIDLYYILSQPSEKGDAVELVHRIAWYVQKEVLSAANIQVEIAFEDRTGLDPEDVTLNELHPLMVQLRPTVGNSRPLNAKDNLLASNAETVIAANPGGGVLPTDLTVRLSDTAGNTMSNTESGLGGVIDDLTTGISATEALLSGDGIMDLSDLNGLSEALKGAAAFGVSNAFPVITESSLEAIAEAMIAQANRSHAELVARQTEVNTQFAAATAATENSLKVAALDKAAKAMFGRNFKVFPEYQVFNPLEVDAAVQYPNYLLDAGEDAIEKWLQGLSPVRKRIHNWHRMGLLSEAFIGEAGHLDLSIAQLPLLPLDGGGIPDVRWLGSKFHDGYAIPDEVLSLVYQLPTAYNPLGVQAGILIDEWTEEIPKTLASTGIAVHYNNPDSEPAQTCLLAVSPNENGKWTWDDFMDTINETFDWARKRAVDPDLLNTTLFGQVLPATYAAISGADDSPTLDYGRNIINVPVAGVADMIKIKDFNA